MSGDMHGVSSAEPKKRDLNPKLEAFPQRLTFARKFHAWTQSELAEKSGIDQASISRYENGERLVSVTADAIIKLSEALRVSLVWLATGDGNVFGDGGPTIEIIPDPGKKKPKKR